MRPGRLIKHEILCNPFGEAKVKEITSKLRSLGLFPKGGRFDEVPVAPAQSAVLLYLLASEAKSSTLRVSLEIFTSLRDQRSGSYFFEDFIKIFKDVDILHSVVDVEVSTSLDGIFAAIRYKDGSFKSYNPAPMEIRSSCSLSGTFLKKFVSVLAVGFEENPEHLVFEKSPTIDSIQKIIDVYKWDERIELTAEDLRVDSDNLQEKLEHYKKVRGWE